MGSARQAQDLATEPIQGAPRQFDTTASKPLQRIVKRGPDLKIGLNRRPKKSNSPQDDLDSPGGSENGPPPYETEGPKELPPLAHETTSQDH